MAVRRLDRSTSHDRGQVVPLVAVAVVLTAGVLLAVVAVGGLLIDRATARTAADAAALAGALGSDEDAAAVAEANGARLAWVVRRGDEVEVRVEVGRAHARARATAVREVVAPARARTRGTIP